MTRRYRYAFITLMVFPLFAGCGDRATPTEAASAAQGDSASPDAVDESKNKNWSTSRKPWWTLAIGKARDALGYSLEVVHDGTGWMLGKATVNIEQIGEARDTTDGKLADFRITVTSSDESFSSEVKDISCDEFGIPNDDSQAKFDEAVEKIKQMLAKLQS